MTELRVETPMSSVVKLPHGRTPPHNLDAERSLLGGILLEPKQFDDVLCVVKGAEFYRDAHRKIFEAMVDLSQRNEPIDRVQVKETLVRMGCFDDVGGDEFLDRLDCTVPTAANLSYYAKIVGDKALARRIIEAAAAVAQLGYEQHGDVQEFADEAEARFFDLRLRQTGGDFKTSGEMVPAVWKEIERRASEDMALVGLPSGLERLDEMTGGFKNENLVVIAARPGVGKSALAADVARKVAEGGGAVAFFSLEMSREELTIRWLSSIAEVNSKHIETGRLSDSEWGRLAGAAEKFAKMPIHLFAKDEVPVSLIRSQSRRLAMKLAGTKTPLRMVCIDYLQLMHINDDAERRDVAIGRNTRQLKGLAKQLQVPVVLLAQLNRETEKRPDRRPRLSDLRESGSIENDADLVLLLHREEMHKHTKENDGLAEIVIAKQRNGPLGTAKVAFKKEYSSFRNLYDYPTDPEQQRLPLPSHEEPPPPTDADAPGGAR